ncbi:hypothetical protein ACTJJ4_07895 [Microbacterium sp. 22195]|uniref:hypothetical protein n=1 Tax=Microbacterium sp. 22195 TaxID=3453891 RepID=UPI003F855C7E
MIDITPECITRSPRPTGVEAPCADCNAHAVWLAEPAPNGARVLVVHSDGCPAYLALRATENGAAL